MSSATDTALADVPDANDINNYDTSDWLWEDLRKHFHIALSRWRRFVIYTLIRPSSG
jgi:hypothetical protein